MKTLTDILAEAIRTGLDAQRDADDFGYWDIDDNCIDTHAFSADGLAEHVAAAYREARTITTREQLEALPGESVIRDVDGMIFERTRDHSINRRVWSAIGTDEQLYGSAVELPALILWLPEESS